MTNHGKEVLRKLAQVLPLLLDWQKSEYRADFLKFQSSLQKDGFVFSAGILIEAGSEIVDIPAESPRLNNAYRKAHTATFIFCFITFIRLNVNSRIANGDRLLENGENFMKKFSEALGASQGSIIRLFQ